MTLRSLKRSTTDWNKADGYDQCFIIDNKTEELSLVAEARSKQSGITLQIFSTEPAVQFYTGQGLDIRNAKDRNHYGPFSGFCLETHKHPNAINVPPFPKHSFTTRRKILSEECLQDYLTGELSCSLL
jgi:aldose 1-epimerase